MDIIVCALLSFSNGLLARKKGQNVAIWVLITIVAFFLTYAIGALIIVALFYRGPFTQSALQEFMLGNSLRIMTFVFAGIGGYMIIRYLLEKMPDQSNNNKREE